MTTQTGTESESGAEARIAGPGGQLRQARIDLKMSPEEVAKVLHLSPRQISALEEDEYDSLPGATYVRGYLRGYAQLLGLSVDPVLEAYNRVAASRKPVVLTKITPPPEIRSDHRLIKFATVAVFVIVVGLSAVWWREQDRSSVVTTDVSPTASVGDAVLPESETASSIIPEPASTSAAIPPPANAGAANTVSVATAKPASPPVASSVPVAPPAPVVSAEDRLKLVFHVDTDSWLDVRDVRDNRLLYQLVLAGQTVVAEGEAPLAVFLGNAEGVRVELNGQPYDFTAYVRGQIARFNINKP